MELFTARKIDHDFKGGIYLWPVGKVPSTDTIRVLDYHGDLFLPISLQPDTTVTIIVQKGQAVECGALLGQSEPGYNIYAPRRGVVGDITTIKGPGDLSRSYLMLHPLPDDILPPAQEDPGLQPIPPAQVQPGNFQKLAVLHCIERSGIIDPETRTPLAELLSKLQRRKIDTVIANTTPYVPTLNTPLALLHNFPGEIFAGLSILKLLLDAREAVLAYPHNFTVNKGAAENWNVRCLPVSEKYPQARPAAIIRTLQQQRYIKRGRRGFSSAAVFDVQLLYQVEQAVLQAKLPLNRVITIAGNGLGRPGHFIVPVGLPLTELLQAGGIYPDTKYIAEGTCLAGNPVKPEQTFIGPCHTTFMVIGHPAKRQPQPCIRCGYCIDYCPTGLDPARIFQLFQKQKLDQAIKYGLYTCIECGICSYICPSSLPIMQSIKYMKEIRKSSISHDDQH